MIKHPIKGTAYILSAGHLSRMMYGPGGAKILAKSLVTPAATPAGKDLATRLWVAYSFSTQDEAMDDQNNQ